MSQNQLAQKYNVPRSTIASRAAKEKWSRDKKEIASEIRQKTTEKIKNSIIVQKVDANTRHIQLISEGLDIVQELLNVYKQELRQGNFKKANAKNLDLLMSAMIKAQRGQRLALNIDDSSDVDDEPEINVIKGLDIGKI